MNASKIVAGLALACLATGAAAVELGESRYYYFQTSVATTHFDPKPYHNNNTALINLERRSGTGLIVGGAYFQNSFDQPSQFAYVGKLYYLPRTRETVYAKVAPRPEGRARFLTDLGAFKIGKSYGAALWASGFAAVPGARVSLDYESLYALGPCCGIDDLSVVIKAAELCDQFGLDTLSTGVTIAWAMECADRGILTPAESDGGPRGFGDAEAVLGLIPRIARREGLGDLLAEGARLAAARLGRGSDRFAMQVKGLELPGYDPRGLKTYALGLAVGTRGGCHNRSAAYEPDMKGRVDRFTVEAGRGRLAKDQEDFAAVLDSLVICKFLRGCFADFWTETAALYRAATGLAVTADDLRQAGERIANLKRMFTVREGLGREQDRLPARLVDEPLPDGVGKGVALTAEELDFLLDDYYAARGWTAAGVPTPETLARLGLADLAGEQ